MFLKKFKKINHPDPCLSKNALFMDTGFGEFKEILNDITTEHGNFQLF